ncbi:hypothetical protein GCM10010271_64950 [Streptomyces kurssanovii]|nr:hypothetical protein GCM10010271_64950 [Streptomyces kurssanovii]
MIGSCPSYDQRASDQTAIARTGDVEMTAEAMAILQAAGAERIEHPGGTLLAHLGRVSALLASWGARPALVSAGLCHAFYGTDGFPVALLDLGRRGEVVKAIGAEAEALVYFYASCDRKSSYQGLTDEQGAFVDRFTGTRMLPSIEARGDFAEITAANELDIAAISPEVRARCGADLSDLFARWRPLLSESAWAHCRSVLDQADH